MMQQILERNEEMSPRQRGKFSMKHRSGHTCEEIARYFGTSVGCLKKTLFRPYTKFCSTFLTKEVELNEGSDARLPELPCRLYRWFNRGHRRPRILPQLL